MIEGTATLTIVESTMISDTPRLMMTSPNQRRRPLCRCGLGSGWLGDVGHAGNLAARHRRRTEEAGPLRVRPLRVGGAEGTRTPDPLHAMQMRYQLRHSPNSARTLADSRAEVKSGSGSQVSQRTSSQIPSTATTRPATTGTTIRATAPAT